MSAQSDRVVNAYFDIGTFQNNEGFNSLKSILIKFLTQEKGIVYPVKEARILSFRPLRITDDEGASFVEISGLEEEIVSQFESQNIDYEDGDFKIVLVDWNFVYCKVPNSFDHYFDISANRYRIEELDDEEDAVLFEDGQSITEDPQVGMALRERQRHQLNQQFKDTRRILGFDTATPTQDRQKMHFTLNKVLPTIHSSATSNSDVVDLGFFGDRFEEDGSLERDTDLSYLDILEADQLVDPKAKPKDVLGEVDKNLPQSPTFWNPESCEDSAKFNQRRRRHYFSSAKTRGFGFNNIDLIGKRQESEPSSNPVDIQDIGIAIMQGRLKWSDLKFDACHIDCIESAGKKLKLPKFNAPEKIIKLLRH